MVVLIFATKGTLESTNHLRADLANPLTNISNAFTHDLESLINEPAWVAVAR